MSQCKILIVPEEGRFGQPKCSTPSKKSSYVVSVSSFIFFILYVKPIRSVLIQLIAPFNKSNIHSFPLLTTCSAFEILLKTFSFNDVNSGKLYILDLLKGSIPAGSSFRLLSSGLLA